MYVRVYSTVYEILYEKIIYCFTVESIWTLRKHINA